jgi:hypothetical protein
VTLHRLRWRRLEKPFEKRRRLKGESDRSHCRRFYFRYNDAPPAERSGAKRAQVCYGRPNISAPTIRTSFDRVNFTRAATIARAGCERRARLQP